MGGGSLSAEIIGDRWAMLVSMPARRAAGGWK
jgi:hypothetical protein